MDDKMIATHIDRAISACLEMTSELMYMRTIGPETEAGRNRLMNGLDELVDMNKSMIDELRKVNDLI